jgi:isoleucyl-tRNA synthetase
VQRVLQAAKAGDWRRTDSNRVEVGGTPLEPGEYDLVLEIAGGTAAGEVGLLPQGGFALLDTMTTPELELEGRARDFIRDVQQARRAAGLAVGDRIQLAVEGDADLLAMLEAHGDLVARETLAVSVEALPAGTGSTGRVLRWPDGALTVLSAGTWGARDGGRFELRKTGRMVIDV